MNFFKNSKKYFLFFSIPIRLWCYSLFRLLHLSTCFNTTSGDSLPLCYELTGTLTGCGIINWRIMQPHELVSWPLSFHNSDLLTTLTLATSQGLSRLLLVSQTLYNTATTYIYCIIICLTKYITNLEYINK